MGDNKSASITTLLNRIIPNATEIGPLAAGMFAQAYAFSADGRDYVLRLNAFEEDFAKDEFAYTNFASPALPIPRMVARGRYDGTRHYAVTERCPGIPMSRVPDAYLPPLLPDLFAKIDAVHALDAGRHTGWGLTDSDFNGRFQSWEIYLRSFYNQKFDYDRPALFAGSILEERLFRELEAEMIARLPACRGYRAIVHGDYGFDNVICRDGRITGVLDWAEGRLGDPLYDVAYLDYWSRLPLGDLWREQARRDPVDFEARMVCYLLHIGLGSMVIAAHLRDERDYRRVRDRTVSVLSPARRRSTDWPEEEGEESADFAD